MKKAKLLFLLIGFGLLFSTVSCKKEKDLSNVEVHTEENAIHFESEQIPEFFKQYPKFKEFESEINELYKNHDYHYIWHDKNGLIDFGGVVYNQVNQIREEGLEVALPYKEKISALVLEGESNNSPDLNSELLISSMYFFYMKNVYHGIDASESKKTGWHLPREKKSYVSYLDTLMQDPNLIKKDDSEMIGQYYNLKKGLQRYREIEKKGGWGTIEMPSEVKSLQPGDSSNTVLQVRERLFVSGNLAKNSESKIFDDELIKGVNDYELLHKLIPDSLITPSLIKHMNVPVQDRIKAIAVNMERCRWISPSLIEGGEYITVNIPSFRLNYFKDGKVRLKSNVVVGKEMNKTVVFSGQMSYIVFSPYWNVPKSIIEKEIKPKMANNNNYLTQENMEWNGGNIRQKPGPKNSLGLVKFMFPNSNNIYLHDSPAKSLFGKETRAFSHGCIRVEKARELAIAILEEDKNWDTKKIDAAMNSGKEKSYTLQKKIPVYIAYFTATADESGNVSFYEDIYNRDNRLASLLYK